ncbi:hypothetical protein MNBD_ALPHA07-1261 [hydrothermal vent metagenome]|uniref:Uncharacterized protein n=1 Tax=hydrothermal vent metagenome TaxID=652676 RepID=A0A3B0SWK3_9ZZZZ
MTLIWLILTGLAFLVFEPRGAFTGRGSALHFIVVLMAILMPVALIWAVATAARSFRQMQDENQRLQAAVDALRQAYIAQNQGHSAASDTSLAKKLDEIAALQRKTEAALAALSSLQGIAERALSPPADDIPPMGNYQVDLPLGTPTAPRPKISTHRLNAPTLPAARYDAALPKANAVRPWPPLEGYATARRARLCSWAG